MLTNSLSPSLNRSEIEAILPSHSCLDWEELDHHQQEKISQAFLPGTTPSYIVYPDFESLAPLIAYANKQQWRILPCGSGTKLGWGGINDIDLVVSTQRLNRIVDHAIGDLTVTVEAGVKLADLQQLLATAGQFLPLGPGLHPDATLGGIIATATTSSWRHRYGGVRDMLLGISFIRSDGQIAKAGGRVVKNVAGYDLMKLFTGSYGTLGIITQSTFRVYPIPEASATVVLSGNTETIAQATATLLASALTPASIDLLSPKLANKLGISEDLSLLVRFQSIAASVEEQCQRLIDIGEKLSLKSSLSADTLWLDLQNVMQISSTNSAIACKIGILPSTAAIALSQMDFGFIHAASGLGQLRFEGDTATPEKVLQARSLCEAQGGFLTVLDAPADFKQQFDIWGYKGNALELMRQIKQQFDPKNILSPHRFVGKI